MSLKMTICLTLALQLAHPLVAIARIRPVWTYEQMQSHSDLVVIAKPVSSTTTDEKSVLPNISPATHVVGFETRLNIKLAFKGEEKSKTFTLHHYALQNPVDGRVRGAPQLVSFDPKQPACYLMFLKREPDGRYAPVTGQTDPAEECIIKLESAAE